MATPTTIIDKMATAGNSRFAALGCWGWTIARSDEFCVMQASLLVLARIIHEA